MVEAFADRRGDALPPLTGTPPSHHPRAVLPDLADLVAQPWQIGQRVALDEHDVGPLAHLQRRRARPPGP